MAGRKPKPTNLKILEGNPGKRPLNLDEPQPETGVICPDWLSARGRTEWKRLKPILENCGILTAADQHTLAAYCEAFENYVRATLEVQNLDSLVEQGSHGSKVSCHVNIQRTYADQMLKWGAKLGLSVVDRTGIKISTPPKASKWASKITS